MLKYSNAQMLKCSNYSKYSRFHYASKYQCLRIRSHSFNLTNEFNEFVDLRLREKFTQNFADQMTNRFRKQGQKQIFAYENQRDNLMID
jgi:hypothetical protein